VGDVEAIVIGAGCGGLSAGALLASQGRRVLVLEQSDAVGGCASSFQREGYTFDVGASVFEVLESLRRTLAALGTTLQDELSLIPCDPTVAVALRDGQRITFPASPGGIVEALAAVSVEDARNWGRYAAYCADLYEVLLDTVYSQPVSTLADLLRILRRRPRMVRYLPSFLTSYQALLARHFTDRAQQCFAFQALTMGLPPELLPGIYAFLPYGQLQGPWYPRGGMIRIPKALQRVGERHGMTLQLRTPVRKVLVERQRAIGVVLADGTEVRSDVVVSILNAKTLYQQLIGADHLPGIVRRGVRSYRYDNALPVVFLGGRPDTAAGGASHLPGAHPGGDQPLVAGPRAAAHPTPAVRNARLADLQRSLARPRREACADRAAGRHLPWRRLGRPQGPVHH